MHKILWNISLILSISSVLILFSSLKPRIPDPDNLTATEALNNMLSAIYNVQSLKFHLKISERIKGEMANYESQSKLIRSPRKLYIYLKGPEVLWVQGQNNGHALVNPGGFPYFNLNLDPTGTLMREGQHHTIHEMGFDYLGNIIRASIKQAGDKFNDYFKYVGEEQWNEKTCYKIMAQYPDFKFIDYKVKPGETIITIARKLNLSEYMILEANAENVSDYENVKSGQTIKIPNAYAKFTILLIDKKTNLPCNTKIYDDKGLFESYEYIKLELNPKFADNEFTKEFKDYNF